MVKVKEITSDFQNKNLELIVISFKMYYYRLKIIKIYK